MVRDRKQLSRGMRLWTGHDYLLCCVENDAKAVLGAKTRNEVSVGDVCFCFRCIEWDPQSHVEWLASGYQAYEKTGKKKKGDQSKNISKELDKMVWSEALATREIHHKESLSETGKNTSP